MSSRYPRLVEYADAIDVDPGWLVTLLTGVRPFPPDVLPAPRSDPESARVRCDRGAASWAQATAEIEREFLRYAGRPWDTAGYARFLSAGPGPSLRLRPARALLALAQAGCSVVVIATAPREFSSAMNGLALPGTSLVHTADLRLARPDPKVWMAAAAAAGVSVGPSKLRIVADAWESVALIESSGMEFARVWLGDDDDEWVEEL